MPLYEDQCRVCGYVHEYLSNYTDQTRRCPKCGGFADRLYSLAAVNVFKSFDTRNISPDGKPMHIGTAGDLTRACHEFGVVPAADAAAPPTRFNPIA